MIYRAGNILPTLGFLGRAFFFAITSALLFISVRMINKSESKDKGVKCRKRLNLARFSGLFMSLFILFAFFAEAEMFAHNGSNPWCPLKGHLYLLVWGVLYFTLQLPRGSGSDSDSNSDWRASVGLAWTAIALVAVIVAVFVGRGRYNALEVTEVEKSWTYTDLAQTKNEDGNYTLLLNVGGDGSIFVCTKDSKTGGLKSLVFPADKLEFRKYAANSTTVAQLVKCDVVEKRYVPYNGHEKPVEKKIGTRTYVEVGDYKQIASGLQRVVLGPDYPIDNVVFDPLPTGTAGG